MRHAAAALLAISLFAVCGNAQTRGASPRAASWHAPVQAALRGADLAALLGDDALSLSPLLCTLATVDLAGDFGARAAEPFAEALAGIVKRDAAALSPERALATAFTAAGRAASAVRRRAAGLAEDMSSGRVIAKDTATLGYTDDLLVFHGVYLTPEGAARLQSEKRAIESLAEYQVLRRGHDIAAALNRR
jgi:hypothetical protein